MLVSIVVHERPWQELEETGIDRSSSSAHRIIYSKILCLLLSAVLPDLHDPQILTNPFFQCRVVICSRLPFGVTPDSFDKVAITMNFRYIETGDHVVEQRSRAAMAARGNQAAMIGGSAALRRLGEVDFCCLPRICYWFCLYNFYQYSLQFI
ncbi:hypothetical protein LIPSTDRAFT_227428 [Lipomyces starkeyi NRRL Y-11557]|uniref:Uncharacterized protein n=1 Tax=Lipomyces starkeyi NRRL Y-11557 TaxID=675824 RepID=A0A1E3QAI4_LIPST|nr:hypothetical protein LIPSTDRAFT_227428 [Lipomyces starkeyi NRRL Y-11557]